MPVVKITGPAGLSKSAKKELIEGSLHIMSETYYLPDDRVYIHEVPVENVGHTPLLKVTRGESWAVQSGRLVSSWRSTRLRDCRSRPSVS